MSPTDDSWAIDFQMTRATVTPEIGPHRKFEEPYVISQRFRRGILQKALGSSGSADLQGLGSREKLS